MSIIREWDIILSQLNSSTIKDRTIAVERVKEFLSFSKNFKTLSSTKSHNWLNSLQALFGTILTEHNIVAQKPSAPALKRLENTAILVRWLIEKVHLLLGRRAIKACINHLSQMVAEYPGVQVYTLTYLRTLRLLLQHPPHLEHLEEKQWGDIVMLSFSSVLGDEFTIGKKFEEDAGMHAKVAGDKEEDGEGGKKQIKIKTALRRTREDQEEAGIIRMTASQEEIEYLTIVEATFRSKSAPFLSHSAIIFTKFLRFFRLFPVETTAHAPAIVALNRAFAELDLNDQKTMRELGPKLWPAILSLWGTKNPLLKEQVIMAHRYLLPFVAPIDLGIASDMVDTKIKPLYEAILTEPTIRWRDGYELNIDTLDLGWEAGGQEERKKVTPFKSETFCLGLAFSDKNAVAWSLLELGADTLARLYSASEATPPAVVDQEEFEGNSRRKRRKIEEPLSALVDDLDSPSLSGVACFRLQVLLFLVERHWKKLHLEISKRILKSATTLLTNDDLQVQNWAFLVVAAIAHCNNDLESGEAASKSWDHIWSIAIRKLSNPATCRVAAHLANILLSADRIETSLVATSIETLSRDIEIQGPSFPSDAVCTFLSQCLTIAANNIRLFRLRLPEKIFIWLSTAWKPLDGIYRNHIIGKSRPRADPLSPLHLVTLISRICGIEKSLDISPTRFIPDCAIASMAVDVCETSVIRAFIEAQVPLYSREDSPASIQTSLSLTATEGIERRVSIWLERTLQGMISEGVEIGEVLWTTMNSESIRRHLDLASIVLIIEGLFEFHKIYTSSPAIHSACSILFNFSPILAFKRWRSDERAFLLAGLDLLFVPFHEYPSISFQVLTDPGIASGIPHHLLPNRSNQSKKFDLLSFPFALLRIIWENESTSQALAEVQASLVFIVTGNESGNSSASPSQATQYGATRRARETEEAEEDDEFGEIKVGKASQISTLSISERAESSVIALCVRGLISREMATAQAGVPVREERLVEALVNADSKEVVIIAEQLFNAVLSGLLTLRLSEAEEILNRIGEDLESYNCARDERFVLVALRFLECTAPKWIMQDDAVREFGTNSRTLCAFFVSNLLHKRINSWRVRLRFATFLDTYLSIDQRQSRWALKREDCMDDDDVGDESVDGVVDASKIEEYMVRAGDGSILYPTSIIPTLLSDQDFRVRFRSASSAPQLLTVCKENGIDDEIVYTNIRDSCLNDPDDIEQTLTQILCSSNIVIVSATRRRSAYSSLISIALYGALYSLVIEATLSGTSKRLGLPNHATLYRCFSRSFAHSTVVTGCDPPEPRACGYSSLSEMRKADFIDVGSIFLLHKMNGAFNTLCDVIDRPRADISLQCLPDALALHILRKLLEVHNNFDPVELEKDLIILALSTGTKDPEELIKSVATDVSAGLLAHVNFFDWPSDPLYERLAAEDVRYITTFKSIFNFLPPFKMDYQSSPAYRSENVIEGCLWFNKQYNCFSDPASLHSIVQKLLNLARRAPFYALQKKHLLAVGIALSIGEEPSTTVLATLTQNLIVLLPQVDLASLVVSMLRWSFTRWDRLEEKNESTSVDLCSSLAQSAYAVKALNQVVRDSKERDVVHGFSNFLKNLIKKIDNRAISKTLPSIRAAVLLWPTPIVDSSTEALINIETALSSSFAPLGKLNLVKSVRTRPNLTSDTMSRRILWNLLAATATTGPECIEDCLGLADFVYDLGGEAQAPGLDDLKRDSRNINTSIEDDIDIQRSIISNILDFADDSDIELVEIVYSTVKSIFANTTMPEVLYNSKSLSPRSLGLANHLSALTQSQTWNHKSIENSDITSIQAGDWMIASRDHKVWTSKLSRLLANYRGKDNKFYDQLGPVLQESRLAISLLPLLVHSILLDGIQDKKNIARNQLSSYFNRLLLDRHTHPETVEAVVNIVLHLRNFSLTSTGRPTIDSWLIVPWISLAEGAVKVGIRHAALLFLELAHEYNKLFVKGKDNQPREAALDFRGQNLLYEIYEHIEEPDGFYGKQTQDHRQALIRRYHHEERWSDAFGIHAAEFESQNQHSKSSTESSSTAGVVKSLASFGFNRLATSILQPARAEGELQDGDLEGVKAYELAWRSSTWDLPIETCAKGSSSVALYSALKCVHAGRDQETIRSVVETFLISETTKLSTISVDLPTPSYEVLSTILALREIHQWYRFDRSETLNIDLTRNWESLPPPFTFKYLEKILSTRISLLRALREQQDVTYVEEASVTTLYQEASALETTCLLQLSRAARLQGSLQTSMNAVTSAYKLISTNSNSFEVEQEFAKVLWAQNEHGTAISLLKSMSPSGPDDQAVISARLGTWTSEARLETTREINANYFNPAIESLGKSLLPSTFSKVYGSYAAFADAQMEESELEIEERRERFTLYEKRKTVEISVIATQIGEVTKGNGNHSWISQLEKENKDARSQLKDDREKLESAEELAREMRWQALENYGKALTDSSEHDDKIHRFCSLWLARAEDSTLHGKLKSLLNKIPSHKFVFLVYQLSARLSSEESPFAANINSLLTRMSSDHPFHTLYQVNALRFASSASTSTSNSNTSTSRRRSSTAAANKQLQGSREKAADRVFDKVKKVPTLTTRVEALELACEAYKEWADYNLLEDDEYSVQNGNKRSARRGNLTIKKRMTIITKVISLPIPVTTYDLPININGDYPESELPCIVKYRSSFTTVGGVNAPKVIDCLDTHGILHKQLLKGGDDIRQDAVMEQAFELMNSLLRKDEKTRRRNLTMRTYKVVPLQAMTGLIKWVDNTKTIGDVINTLYSEFKPGTLNVSTARKLIVDAKEKDITTKRKALQKVYANLPPVMRHWFFKKHKVPSLWFDMRLNYSRSVAVTSIVGYIVGLGDRHVSNILMDEVRGDLVTIDLGIAFEAGTRLPTPEKVPFRLTPNIVDAFGMNGVDGVFRRCAEETLRVLRDNASLLMTIFDVFKHDPLQNWTLAPETVARLQGLEKTGITVDELPDDADRALTIVAGKLRNKLSVEYSVNLLIREATDIDNLAQIYVGWSPHL